MAWPNGTQLLSLTSQIGTSTACPIPPIIRGSWFSWENGQNTLTEINAESMSRKGFCVAMMEEYHVNYTFVFKENTCYHCVKLIVRTVNILEKIESGCVNLPQGVEPTLERVCRGLNPDQQLVTLFSENPIPVNCRSSLEGVWQFAYQNRFRFTGECDHPEAQIRSCQTAGTQFLITNQKFNITYKKCTGMTGTFDGVVEYSCLGDWFVDKNHFFAVSNTKESRKDEKYRCFLKNRDDDLYLGVSITAECNTLKTVERSPERLRVTPVKSEVVEPGCHMPQNFSGDWINTANIDADIFINETHIIETWYPDEGRYRKTIYVCREQRDTRYMMARLTVDGWPRHPPSLLPGPLHNHVLKAVHDEFISVLGAKENSASIGSRDGHYPFNLHAPMGSPCFSHWTRPGSSGGKCHHSSHSTAIYPNSHRDFTLLGLYPTSHRDFTLPGLYPTSHRDFTLPGLYPTSHRDFTLPGLYPTSHRDFTLPGLYPTSHRDFTLPGLYPTSHRDFTLPGLYPTSHRDFTLPGLYPTSHRDFTLPGLYPTSHRDFTLPGLYPTSHRDFTLPGLYPTSHRDFTLPGLYPTSHRDFTLPGLYPTSHRDFTLPGLYPTSHRDFTLPGLYPTSHRDFTLPGLYPTSHRDFTLPGLYPTSHRDFTLPGLYPTSPPFPPFTCPCHHGMVYARRAGKAHRRKTLKKTSPVKQYSTRGLISYNPDCINRTSERPHSAPTSPRVSALEICNSSPRLPLSPTTQPPPTPISPLSPEGYYVHHLATPQPAYVFSPISLPYPHPQDPRDRYLITKASRKLQFHQKDYVCFDFVPQHHNIIRYRRGVAVIIDDFHTVCSWVQFKNEVAWKYSLYLAKNPIPVRCPIAGKFNFTQKGEVPFETRILGGVTLSPRPNIYCKQNISDFSVCDTDQKEVSIDETYCLSVDYLGRPVDIYTEEQVRNKTLSLTMFCPLTGDPDYRMKCIGFWKENLKSYLITYDELDPFSKYRCWVYQRADLNRVLISQAIGPFCDLKQDVTSWNSSEGASVALEMQEYERERDQCPMYFDDGTNPWLQTENYIKVFHFGYYAGANLVFNSTLCLVLALMFYMCAWRRMFV
uniref:Uncharacterized protein n=1 Tax=Timema genevievae TaxID=629358 RepID=A0A7R9K1J5_TIMGE|nr:unnamed protein product [Timema genevievae]